MPVRLLRPTLRTSERWHRASYFDRCFYISLLNLVDDFGRYDANPALLASECFPYGAEDGMPVTRQAADGALRSLASKDLLVVYEHEGKPYLYLTRWHERTRQVSSRFPDPKNCKVVWQITGKCPTNDGQVPASPPSPTPSPVPTPTPVVRDCPTTAVAPTTTSVCVSNNETSKQKDDFHLQNRLTWFKDHLSAMFRRPNGVRMSYEEESTITEIARRPDAQEELRCIERWKATIPSSKLRFFPQSMGSLLRSWDETLDKARCKVDMRDKASPSDYAKSRLLKTLSQEVANP